MDAWVEAVEGQETAAVGQVAAAPDHVYSAAADHVEAAPGQMTAAADPLEAVAGHFAPSGVQVAEAVGPLSSAAAGQRR